MVKYKALISRMAVARGKILLTCIGILPLCCSMLDAPSGSGTDWPRTNSIIPLAAGNAWTYSFSSYNPDGSKGEFSREPFIWEVPKVFTLTHDGQMISFPSAHVESRPRAYVYQYESEHRGYGDLIAYLDSGVTVPGLYLMGTYEGEHLDPYPEPRLWLGYKVPVNTSWTISHRGRERLIEVLGVQEKFSAPDPRPSSVSALRFYDGCYLYREKYGDTATYIYCHEQVGMLGSLTYVGKSLLKSMILISSVLN